jgi:CheY-like chemotaxis protein
MAIEILKMYDQDIEAKTSHFDLVITDLEMQGKTGFDVSQFVKNKNRNNKFTPVILLTGKSVTKEEARKFGCATCVPKSNLQKLLSMVKILFPG